MTPASIPLPTFPTTRAHARLVAVAVGGAAVVAAALLLAGQAAQATVALAAAGVCLAASIVSLEPIRMAANSAGGLQRVMLAAMLSFPLRLAVVAGGVAALAALMKMPLFSLSLWAMGWYLVLLGVEVAFLAGYLKSAGGCDAVTPQGTARNA